MKWPGTHVWRIVAVVGSIVYSQNMLRSSPPRPSDMTLFRNRIAADKMRSHCSRVGPHPFWWVSLQKRRGHTGIDGEESHVLVQAEAGETEPQAKACTYYQKLGERPGQIQPQKGASPVNTSESGCARIHISFFFFSFIFISWRLITSQREFTFLLLSVPQGMVLG